ncbi:MAG: GNAT family N-acetyltransferase [Alphaproteobacteria bacterium]
MAACTIRLIRPEEVDLLPKMERAADQRFIDAGYFSEADIGPGDFQVERYREGGPTWMAVDERDSPMGFIHMGRLPQGPHIEELSVLPEHGRKGVGTALLHHVLDLAREANEFAVTLATDIHVPWNAPYYEKIGFEAVSPMALGREYLDLRAAEAAKNLNPNTRQIMIYYLNPVSRNEPAAR